MPEVGATTLAAARGRLEWLGPIAAAPAPAAPGGLLMRGLDLLDILLANSLEALFATCKR